MSDGSRLFTRVLYGFDAAVARAPRDSWDVSSPCTEWIARDVVSHVCMACSMITGMARGEPAVVPGTEGRPAPGVEDHVMREALAEMMERPVIGSDDDPGLIWRAYRDDVLEAIDDPGNLDRPSMGTFGPTTPGEFIVPVGFDIVIHTWDLAVALGQQVVIDDDLAALALAGFSAGEAAGAPIRQPRVMGDRVKTRLSDPVSELIAFSGRDPSWSQ